MEKIIEEISKMPVPNIPVSEKKYVLALIDDSTVLPVTYNNDVNILVNEINEIEKESIFKTKRVNDNKLFIEDINVEYNVLEVKELFS